jgi:hypothetical protein
VNAVIEFDDGIVGPESFADVLPVQQGPATLYQHQQDLEWLLLEQNFSVIFTQFSGTEVEFELAEANAAGSVYTHT